LIPDLIEVKVTFELPNWLTNDLAGFAQEELWRWGWEDYWQVAEASWHPHSAWIMFSVPITHHIDVSVLDMQQKLAALLKELRKEYFDRKREYIAELRVEKEIEKERKNGMEKAVTGLSLDWFEPRPE
jgi:hypothetical protein